MKISHYRLNDFIVCPGYKGSLHDIAIPDLVAFHKGHGKLSTITSVQPPGRFGAVAIEDGGVVAAC